MSRAIAITCGTIRVIAVLNDSSSADAIWNALPIDGTASTWGDEVYFSTAISLQEENPTEVVELGAVAYWPPGRAVCLFFGPTPASHGNEIRPASAVYPLGLVQGDPTVLKHVSSGTAIRIDPA